MNHIIPNQPLSEPKTKLGDMSRKWCGKHKQQFNQ